MTTDKDCTILQSENEVSHRSLENGHAASPIATIDDPSSPDRNDKVAELVRSNDVLVREVTSLRAEKANLRGKVEELEKQLEVDTEKVERLLNEKNGIEERASGVLLEVSNLRNEFSALKACQSVLENDKSLLYSENERLEAELLKCKTDLTETRKLLQEENFKHQEVTLKISALEHELLKLYDDEKKLTAEHESLVADNREKDERILSLKAQKVDLDEQIQRLLFEVGEAVEQSSVAKQTIAKLCSEEMRLKDENSQIESALAMALQESLVVGSQNQTLEAQLRDLEGEISNLQAQLNFSLSNHDNVVQNLAKEQEHKSGLEKELATMQSERRSLQGSLESALAEAQKYREIVKKDQSQVSMLGDQVSALIREKLWVEEAKLALEVEVKKLAAKSAEVLRNAQQETADWRQKVEMLERALEKINDESADNERKVWQLVSELKFVKGVLERKLAVNKYAICAALASTGSLAALGVALFLRGRRQS